MKNTQFNVENWDTEETIARFERESDRTEWVEKYTHKVEPGPEGYKFARYLNSDPSVRVALFDQF